MTAHCHSGSSPTHLPKALGICSWLSSPTCFLTAPSWGTPSPLSSMLNIGGSQNLACLIIIWEMAKSTDSCPCWLVPAPSSGARGWALFSTLNAFQFLQYQAFAVSSLLTVARSSGRSQLMAHYCQAGFHAPLRGFYLRTHHKAMQLQKLASTCVNDSKLPGDRNRTHLAHLLYPQGLAQYLPHA